MTLIPGILHILTKASGTQQIVYQEAAGQHWQVLAVLTEQGSIGVEATHVDEIGDDEMVELASDRALKEFFDRWHGADIGRAVWLTRLFALQGLRDQAREQLTRVTSRAPFSRAEVSEQAATPAS